MGGHYADTNVRPDPDQELVDIANYVCDYEITSAEAYDTARNCLMDSLGCALLAYFPFSKLMHMPGVFLSPTRNLANDNRARRHVNPWNAPVKVHTYEEWEEEFHKALKSAGFPLEKEYKE